jgi:hypothetical protein
MTRKIPGRAPRGTDGQTPGTSRGFRPERERRPVATLTRAITPDEGGVSQVHNPDRGERLEALLREAIVWCPRLPTHPTGGKIQAEGRGWVDLGNRIEAELGICSDRGGNALDGVTEQKHKGARSHS